MMFTDTINVLKAQRGGERARMTRNDEKQAESFFFIVRVFLLLNDIYRYYGCYKSMEGLMEDAGEENGPK